MKIDLIGVAIAIMIACILVIAWASIAAVRECHAKGGVYSSASGGLCLKKEAVIPWVRANP